MFSSLRAYSTITKSVEQVTTADRIVDAMRRAFAQLKLGRPGPVMMEIPTDVATEEIDGSILESYKPSSEPATLNSGWILDSGPKRLPVSLLNH